MGRRGACTGGKKLGVFSGLIKSQGSRGGVCSRDTEGE